MQDYWSKYSPAPMAGSSAQQKQAAYKPTPDDNKTLTEMAHALPTMRTLAQRATDAMQVQGSGANAVPTGPALAKWDVGGMDLNPIRGAVAAAGLVSPQARDMANRLQRMDQINSETFALIRPEGSGRIMQSEIKPFKQSFPSAGAYGTNNADSAKQFADEYQDRLSQYQFVSNFVRNGHGSAADGLAAYDAAKGAGGGQQPGQGSGSTPTAQQSVNAALKARSAAAAPQPAAAPQNGAVVDIFGRPVQ